MSVSIGVVSRREGTFIMNCRATGGTLTTSSFTGPGLGGGGLQLQAVGSIGRTGQNTYSVTNTLSGQSNGATYTCRAMNDVSSPEMTTVLAGIHTCIVYIALVLWQCYSLLGEVSKHICHVLTHEGLQSWLTC